MAAGLRLGSVLTVALALGACSSMSKLLDKESSTSTQAAAASSDGIAPDLAAADKTEPVGPLYNKGLEQMQAGEYRTAAKTFGEVERQHPYSQWATKAQLMQAYSQYQRNAYDEAINAAQRFLTLHPGHKDASYAYYLIALSNYEQIIDVRRDQTNTQKALASLEEVSRRYPGTAYAQDAQAKATLARDHLAGKEMEVGRYYLKKGSYLAGINRFKRVITEYQNTSHTPEALYRLTEGYLALGVRSEAQTAAAVLGHNYPNSEWYQDAYALLQNDGVLPSENKQSWISKALSSVNPF
ncbi:MAG: outer membrane protein assembly factor BamD [Parvibaculaceae bacterium]